MTTPQQRGVVQAVITLAFVGALCLLAFSFFVEYVSAKRAMDNAGWVAHSHEVLAKLEGTFSALGDAEGSQRGYLITGEKSFLDTFAEQEANARARLEEAASLTRDNAAQQGRISALRGLLESKLGRMSRLIALHQDKGFEAARKEVASLAGKAEMDQIRSLISAMEAQELGLLNVREEDARRSAGVAWISFGVTATVGLVLVIGLFILVERFQSQQRSAALAEQRHKGELEFRVAERTEQLVDANREMEAFSYSVSHDLRAPLRHIGAYAATLQQDLEGRLSDGESADFERIRANVVKMSRLIDDLLRLSNVVREDLVRESVDLSMMARRKMQDISQTEQRDGALLNVADGIVAFADPSMVGILLENLLRNAWKFSRDKPHTEIEFGQSTKDGRACYFVRDNGAGFEVGRLTDALSPFVRLHADAEFEGTGVGLAICQRIVNRHGGEIWADSEVGKGSTFYFTLEPAREG